MFSYMALEQRVPQDHPLREIRRLTDVVLRSLSGEFDSLYSASGRPSIAPEYVLRALLLQAFYSVRSERQLVEQLDYNLLFRGFVAWVWTTRCGTMRCSRRTTSVCLPPTWRSSSSPP
jgi:transposase